MKKTIFTLLVLAPLAIVFIFFVRTQGERSYGCKDCNVIFITLTNLRYDHLSHNGYFRPTSPNLDAFAKESIVFDNAFSHSSWTLPEAVSLYTSLYPYQHKVMNRYDGRVLSGETDTLVDILHDKGYKTAAFTGGFDYNSHFGLTSRFGEYQECKSADSGLTLEAYGKISCTAQKALEWVKNNRGSKFFVHVQGFDTHCPFARAKGDMYDADYAGSVDFSKCLWTFDKADPVTKDGKKYYPVYSPTSEGKASILLGEGDIEHLVALYDETITLSDEDVDSFLKEIKKMGLYKNTIIVFTSEHGDMFGKQGRFMRGGPLGGTFYDDVLKIPLIMKIPGVTSARIDGLVQHIDIMPTLLDLLSLTKSQVLEGKSLLPLVSQGREVNQYVFAGSEFSPAEDNLYLTESTRVEAVRSKQWKLIKEEVIGPTPQPPTFELYDIANDKEEFYNLIGAGGSVFDDLKLRLSDWSGNMRKE